MDATLILHVISMMSFFHFLSFARFLLDFDIAAPKITIPTDFCPDNKHSTKLMLDLGNLLIHTEVVAENNRFNIY